MLDDLKYIHQRDTQDALGIAEKQWQQLEYSFEIPHLEGTYENIVYSGMGGSALAGLLSQSWPGYKVPFEVCRSYDIPSYVNEKTLFLSCSYSGNTEEILEALKKAEAASAKIVIFAGGGKLAEQAQAKSYPLVVLPQAKQPRYGVLYNLNALISLLEPYGLLKTDNAKSQLKEASEQLKQSVTGWLPTVPANQNQAKKLALDLAGKSVVIYSGPKLAPAAYKWKISFNENAKNVAWYNQYPEFNHNEFIGWSSHPVEKPYAIIELQSNLEHLRIQKRFELTQRLLSGLMPAPNIIQVQGNSLLEQLLWSVVLGDFVSIYLALINNVDPAPVDLVEKFKTQLNT